MATFLLSLLVLSIIVGAMSIGVLMGKKPITGTCGGMSAIGMDTVCDICGGDPKRCDEVDETNIKTETNVQAEKQAEAIEKLSYDATAPNK